MEKKTVEKTTVICYTLKTSLKAMHDDIGNLPDEIAEKIAQLKLIITGTQIWVYEGSDGNPNTKFELTIAIPVNKTDGDPGKFRFAEFPEFKCISEIHKGSWTSLGKTYQKLMPAIMQQGHSLTGISREVYTVCDFENQENCITEIQNDPQLIAYCGLYCGACGKYLNGKCPSCKQIQGKHWCKIRTCNIDQQFSSCSDCSLETPNVCRKFNNPISKVFAFIFGSNREKCILTIRENGAVWYAAHMSETRQQSLKNKAKRIK